MKSLTPDLQNTTMNLLPPPANRLYDSIDQALQDLNEFAATQGYALSKGRLKKRPGTNVPYQQYFLCSRAGVCHSDIAEEARKRNKGSNKCDCPFQLSVTKPTASSHWRIIPPTATHNHEASEAVALAKHRRISPRTRKKIANDYESGATPRFTLTAVSKSSENPITLQDIKNVRKKHRTESLQGKTEIQTLLQELIKADWEVKYYTEITTNPQSSASSGQAVRRLFFAHPESIKLLVQFPEVLLMDCTYNTNRFNVPLFTIIGVTNLGTTFTLALSFLASEEKEEYIWALKQLKNLYKAIHFSHPISIVTDADKALISAIQSIFPRSQKLLCRWHIAKNIASHCRSQINSVKTTSGDMPAPDPRRYRADDSESLWKEFEASWWALVSSKSAGIFTEGWQAFKGKYGDFPDIIKYISNQWIPLKTFFVDAWINEDVHFGNTSTSRVEAHHSQLKQQLCNNQGHIRTVYQRAKDLIDRQCSEFRMRIAQAKITEYPDLKISILDDVRQLITPKAQRLILEQYKSAAEYRKEHKNLPPCTFHFTRSMGLPCRHTINEMLARDQMVQLYHVNEFWWYNRRSRHTPSIQGDSPSVESHPVSPYSVDARTSTEAEVAMRLQGLPGSQGQIPVENTLIDPILRLRDPPVKPRKGAPKGTRISKTSTKRYPSTFELVGPPRKRRRGCNRRLEAPTPSSPTSGADPPGNNYQQQGSEDTMHNHSARQKQDAGQQKAEFSFAKADELEKKGLSAAAEIFRKLGEIAQSEMEAHISEPNELPTAEGGNIKPKGRPETPRTPLIIFSDKSPIRPSRDSSKSSDLLSLSPRPCNPHSSLFVLSPPGLPRSPSPLRPPRKSFAEMKAEQEHRHARWDRLDPILDDDMDNSIPLQREAALGGYCDEFLYLYHQNRRPFPFSADDNSIVRRVQQRMKENSKVWQQKWRRGIASVMKLNADLEARLDAAWPGARDEWFEFYPQFSLPRYLPSESDQSTYSSPGPVSKESIPETTKTTAGPHLTRSGRVSKPTAKARA